MVDEHPFRFWDFKSWMQLPLEQPDLTEQQGRVGKV